MFINLIKSLFIHMFTYWIVVLPDFIEGCSLLGAKQCKMYALTLGLGGPGLPGPPGSATGPTQWLLRTVKGHLV